jgi:hypothetical protein
MELRTRKVEIAGVTSAANGLWMTPDRAKPDRIGEWPAQGQAVFDRDPLFTTEFLAHVRPRDVSQMVNEA